MSAAPCETTKLHQHLGSILGVAVPKLDHVVVPAFQSRFPVGRSITVLNLFRFSDDIREGIPVEIEVQNAFHRSDFAIQNVLQDVTMTVRFVFCTVA